MNEKHTKLYAAYGSNMNKAQMAYRCPNAKYYACGVIKDFELQFKGYKDNSYATISESSGSSVAVVLWLLTERDETSLDEYEGYPTFYQKQMLTVTLNDGSATEAMVYVMDKSRDFGMPSVLYYRTIVQGYNDFGIDLSLLYNALGINTRRYYEAAVNAIDEEIRRRFPEPPEDI